MIEFLTWGIIALAISALYFYIKLGVLK